MAARLQVRKLQERVVAHAAARPQDDAAKLLGALRGAAADLLGAAEASVEGRAPRVFYARISTREVVKLELVAINGGAAPLLLLVLATGRKCAPPPLRRRVLPRPRALPQRRARRAAASTWRRARRPPLSADLGGPSTLYAPFAERALELLRDAVPLRPYAIPPELRRREGSSGRGARAQPVRAWPKTPLRQAAAGRLAHVQGGDRWVLNLCIFPQLKYGLPSFAADLVTLPGGHLIHRLRPHAADRRLGGDAAALEAAHARHSLRLPDGGPIPAEAQRFFSPCFLWTRLPLSDEQRRRPRPRLRRLRGLRGYLAVVAAAARSTTPPRAWCAPSSWRTRRTAPRRTRARDALAPLRPVHRRLIDEVLFDLPRAVAAGGKL